MSKGCVGCMGNEESRQYCRSCGDIKPNKKLMSWLDEYTKETPCVVCGKSKEDFEAEYEGGYMDGFKYVVDLIENFHKTEGEKLNLSFEEFVILENLLDYIKKCR